LSAHKLMNIWLFPHFGYYEQCCYEHSCANFCLNTCFQFFWLYIWGYTVELYSNSIFNGFFLTILEFELRASCLWSRCSYTWATAPSPFLCCVFLR
jgi:hypothetical protein